MTLRRTVLLAGGTALAAAIAGCVSDDSDDETSDEGGTDEPDGTDETENGETDDSTTDGDTTGDSDERQLDSPEDAVHGLYEEMNEVETIDEYFAVVEWVFHSDSQLRKEWEEAAQQEEHRAELEEEIEADLWFEDIDTTVVETDLTGEELVDGGWFRDDEEAQPFVEENALVETGVELSEGDRTETWTETWLVSRESDAWQLVYIKLEAQQTPAFVIEWDYDDSAEELEIRVVGGDIFEAGAVEIDGGNVYGHAGNTWDEYDPDVDPDSEVSAGDRIVLTDGDNGDAVGPAFDVDLVWTGDGEPVVIDHVTGPDA